MNSGERYHLLEKIATGSFATVYRAHDEELKREVAVKQIHEQFLNNPEQLDRYWEEAQLLASLQHPNIVTIYDIVRDKGWLIMELMQSNLVDRLQGKPMDLVGLRTVLAHCLRALKFLHEHGIVHGDIKPGNMLIDRRKRIKIGDFGLARRVSDEEGSLIKGTTKYMAPEVVSDEFGDVGPASDLYSLGFSAYELMCGDNFDSLFPGLNAHGRDKQLAWIMWHAAPDRRLPPISRVLEGVPEDLAKVIQKLSTKDPAKRYRTADEALADLNVDTRIVKGEEPAAEEKPPVDAAARRKRAILIAAMSLSLSLSLFMILPSSDDVPKPKSASGLIRDVRLDKHEIVVEDEASGVPEVINVGAKPSFYLRNDKKKILLEEVHPGDRIRFNYKGNSIEFVLTRPIETMGEIIRLNGVKKEIVVETDLGKRSEIPVLISPASTVTLNGDKVPFSDIHEGDRVDVRHLSDPNNEDVQIALTVAARRTVRATGFVRVLNWQKHKLAFDVRQGMTTRLIELPFSNDCQVTLPGGNVANASTLKSEDLQTGDRVSVEFDTEISKVVASRNQSLRGVVKVVSADTNSVTIQTGDGQQHPLKITPETEIDIGGELARFDELREYDECRATYQEQDDGGGAVAVTIDATRPIKQDRTAIVIGIQNYDDKSVTRAKYILDDVQTVANTLKNRYGVAPERLLVLKDVGREKLKSDLTRTLQDVLAQTQVLVYVEGQAFEGAGGKYFLAARDFKLNQPAETGVPLDWLIETLEKCVSTEKLLVLDTCQGDETGKSAPQPSPVKMLESVAGSMKTLRAIGARGDNELGQAWPEKNRGSFAWQVSEGIRGSADTDHDLFLRPHELQDYLQLSLPKLSFDKVRPQSPKLFP